eukprot:177118-Pyramimonas_sp.AAC.1
MGGPTAATCEGATTTLFPRALQHKGDPEDGALETKSHCKPDNCVPNPGARSKPEGAIKMARGLRPGAARQRAHDAAHDT